jgi:hypothetical protein
MFCHLEIYIPTVHTKTNTQANNVYDISSGYIQVLFKKVSLSKPKTKQREERDTH